jgi:hypothetical protein
VLAGDPLHFLLDLLRILPGAKLDGAISARSCSSRPRRRRRRSRRRG